MKISKQQLHEFGRRERAHFVNQLTGFKPAALIGTRSMEYIENLAIFSQIIHVGADPALIGILSRPDSVVRGTLSNIQQTGAFTINQVAQSFFKQAHQSAARYNEAQSEFKEVGLTPVYDESCYAPMVEESPLKLCLTLKEMMPVKSNGTTLIIGEVTSIYLPESALSLDKTIDYQLLDTVTVTGLDTYYLPKKLARLSYAKPDKTLEIL